MKKYIFTGHLFSVHSCARCYGASFGTFHLTLRCTLLVGSWNMFSGDNGGVPAVPSQTEITTGEGRAAFRYRYRWPTGRYLHCVNKHCTLIPTSPCPRCSIATRPMAITQSETSQAILNISLPLNSLKLKSAFTLCKLIMCSIWICVIFFLSEKKILHVSKEMQPIYGLIYKEQTYICQHYFVQLLVFPRCYQT